MKEKWINALPQKKIITKNSVVCSLHSKLSDFYEANSRRMIETYAVPSVSYFNKYLQPNPDDQDVDGHLIRFYGTSFDGIDNFISRREFRGYRVSLVLNSGSTSR